MSQVTIRLELLRSGPPHNQLLSPLTPYLAVCGNRPAETVHLASEHLDTLERLERLRYQAGRAATDAELRAAAEPVARLLGTIQGLQQELSVAYNQGAKLVHLRLILSAQELSLLPFELAQAPVELGGVGRLGFALPPTVVLTRETRREARPVEAWPASPRILLVTADPSRRGLPALAHRLALRKALAPWLDRAPREAGDAALARPEDRDAHITVLEEATLPALARHCAETAYTHVHILCHGAKAAQREGAFGLAFHDPRSPSRMQWVDGTRLASALMAGVGPDGHRGPAVVTLAVCDASNIETVVRPNASVAHALHLAGVPLVVGSQLPLTFEGSALLTERLYVSLLAGESPVTVLGAVRANLLRALPTTQDWAALVVYSSLPEDFTRRLHDAQAEALKMQVERTFETYDRFGLASTEKDRDRQALCAQGADFVADPAFRTKLEAAVAAARALGPTTLMRYVGSYKRLATLGLRYDGETTSDDQAILASPARIALLRKALEVAEEVYAGARSGWSAVQRLTLCAALEALCSTERTRPAEFTRLWRGARFLVEEERRAIARGQRIVGMDGRTSVAVDCDALDVQLWVLSALRTKPLPQENPALERLCAEVQRVPDLRATRGYSLLREMHRFEGWWFAAAEDESGRAEVRRRARVVINGLLGAGVQPRYRPLRRRAS